jgi:hypothetical protein
VREEIKKAERRDNDQTGAEITRRETRSEQKQDENRQKPSCGIVAVNIIV